MHGRRHRNVEHGLPCMLTVSCLVVRLALILITSLMIAEVLGSIDLNIKACDRKLMSEKEAAADYMHKVKETIFFGMLSLALLFCEAHGLVMYRIQRRLPVMLFYLILHAVGVFDLLIYLKSRPCSTEFWKVVTYSVIFPGVMVTFNSYWILWTCNDN